MPNNLFALTDNTLTPVRRIPLTDELSTELTTVFSDQENDFLNEKQEVEFTGSYNVDGGESLLLMNIHCWKLSLML